tara:strand:+ start:2561 stop:3205 length:645 start_codon:yes stop_codon:yes gene_type:complete
MPNKIGIFFDLDGTLVENKQQLFLVYRNFMKNHILKHSKEEFESYNGVPLETFINDTKEKYNISIPSIDLVNEYLSYIDYNYLKNEPSDGVLEVFTYLKKHKFPYAIVTSNKKSTALKWINAFIPETISPILISSDDTNKSKPHPEPYLKAMEILSCDYGYAVEDSENGIISAHNAGLKVIQLKYDGVNIQPYVWRTINMFCQLMPILYEIHKN